MSIRAMTWAFDTPCPTPSAKLVLLKLADHANDEGECWPSQGRIASDCGLTRQTVNEQIRKLVNLGLIKRENRFNGTGQQTNRYFLQCREIGHPLSGNPTGVSAQATPPVGSADTEPSEEPLEERPPRTPRKRGADLEGFSEWYEGYPRHVSRGAAEKAWPRARNLASVEELIGGRDRYIAECVSHGTDKQFIKHPSVWLNNKCWLDDYEATGALPNGKLAGPSGPPPKELLDFIEHRKMGMAR